MPVAKYIYTKLEELDLLRQLQTNGMKDVGKIICLCFDNGIYGQERVGSQSVTARQARMSKRHTTCYACMASPYFHICQELNRFW